MTDRLIHVCQATMQENGRDGGDRPALILMWQGNGATVRAHKLEVDGPARVEQFGPSSAHLVVSDEAVRVRALVRNSLKEYVLQHESCPAEGKLP